MVMKVICMIRCILTSFLGTINCIESFGNFVFTGADDGLIIMWRVQEWSHLLTLKGHKKAVNDMAIHSSGKIMASVGADNKLILWNLMKGTKIFRKTYDVSKQHDPISEFINLLC